MSKRYKAKRRARFYRRQRRCQHPGCAEEGIPCLLQWWNKTADEFFCWEHAFEHGYCRSCGVFWSGVESFDFGSGGLCEQCRDQIRADTEEDGLMDYWMDGCMELQPSDHQSTNPPIQ